MKRKMKNFAIVTFTLANVYSIFAIAETIDMYENLFVPMAALGFNTIMLIWFAAMNTDLFTRGE